MARKLEGNFFGVLNSTGGGVLEVKKYIGKNINNPSNYFDKYPLEKYLIDKMRDKHFL